MTHMAGLCTAVSGGFRDTRLCLYFHFNVSYFTNFRSGDGGFIPSRQLHNRRSILLLNTTYTATCFGRTTIFKQKYIVS
jgi:hypothetical protein